MPSVPMNDSNFNRTQSPVEESHAKYQVNHAKTTLDIEIPTPTPAVPKISDAERLRYEVKLEPTNEPPSSGVPVPVVFVTRETPVIPTFPTQQITLAVQNEASRPERAKWHSEIPVNGFTHSVNEVAAKKCTPKPVLFSQGSTESDEEENERAEFDFEDESDSEAYSDDGIPAVPAVKACRKVDLLDDDIDAHDLLESWEVEPAPIPGDYFGRLQVPLDSIQEESEDDDGRESMFTRTINRKAMRPVVNLDLSPDDEEAPPGTNGHDSWPGDGRDEGQSDLEQYYITGLLQSSTAVGKQARKPYFRDDMDFDAMEEEEEDGGVETTPRENGGEGAGKAVGEPSIFGSARLKFATTRPADNYRLSSDMDDLSASSPSDDESFY